MVALAIIAYIIGAILTYISNGYLEFHETYKEDYIHMVTTSYGRSICEHKAGDLDCHSPAVLFAIPLWPIFWSLYIPYKLTVLGNAKMHDLRVKELKRIAEKAKLRVDLEKELAEAEAEINSDWKETNGKQN